LDLAGTGNINIGSMLAAINLAVELVNNRVWNTLLRKDLVRTS
jgi:4-hydroxy-L-threonine phosphate dehydrogenase PdxA